MKYFRQNFLNLFKIHQNRSYSAVALICAIRLTGYDKSKNLYPESLRVLEYLDAESGEVITFTTKEESQKKHDYSGHDYSDCQNLAPGNSLFKDNER